MIKSVFSAHLSERDKNDLTLLFNDRSIGLLSDEEKANFVLASNRSVHMISGFSNESIYYDPRFNKDRIRLWNQAFREMQSRGIKAFPQFIRDHHVYAEYLYIFSADIFIGWQDRKNGLYLIRNGNLYRLQPTLLPAGIFDEEWMQYTDFYSFAPKTDDFVFSISEKIFERTDAKKAEELLAGNLKPASMLNELLNQIRLYNEEFDASWFGFEVERLNKNIFADDHQSRLRKHNDFTTLINSSRVSRVKDGQKLLPVRAADYKAQPKAMKKNLEDQYLLPKQNSRPAKKTFNHESLSSIESRNSRKRNLHKLEQRRKNKDIILDDLKFYSFEPVVQNFKKTISNLFNLIPNKPFLSKLLSTTAILILVLFIFLLGRTIGSRAKPVEEEIEKTTFETRRMNVDEKVVPPNSALLEVDITVKANNLQIRQEPKADSALVATVQRGAKVTQLSEIENNWVYVRLENGKTVGYAYADSLFPDE